MKRNMRIELSPVQSSGLFSAARKTLLAPLVWLSLYYGSVLEREISLKQTLHFVHVQLAFVAAVFAEGASVLTHLGLLAWFLLALWWCKSAVFANEGV